VKGAARLAVALAGLGALGAHSCWFAASSPYRGFPYPGLEATGRFRVAEVDGVWWLVTPDGALFFSAGVNNVSSWADYAPDLGTWPYRDNVLARWGSEEAWADEVIRRFDVAGVNTAGAWSQLERFRGRFPYTQILSFADAAPTVASGGPFGAPLRDFFDPSFESSAPARAEEARPCAEDPFCIGVFTDNELPWGRGFNQLVPFLDAYLALPAGAPGKLALQAFLEERYAGDVAAFDAVWGADLPSFDALQDVSSLPGGSAGADADRLAFRGHVAARYYRVAHDALRVVSPDMLILGSRYLAYHASAPVVEAAAPYVDVISINNYEYDPGWFAVVQGIVEDGFFFPVAQLFQDLDAIHALTGKPVMVTEFGYRAADAGLPNSHPPVYPILPDQAARADAYSTYMDAVLARSYLVGAHWFEYADEPATGRFDGEDDNWGFVDVHDDLYPALFVRMWGVNGGLYPRRLALVGGG
jgi:hypothetical protein